MNRKRVLADEFVVELHDAFPSYAGAAEAERVVRILAHPSRSRWTPNPDRPKAEGNAVAYLRCAFELEPGKRCGRILRPVAQRQLAHAYGYMSTSCPMGPSPHRTWVTAVVDDHILEIVQEVFSRENLERLAQRFEVQSEALLARRQQIEGALARLVDDAEGASDLAIKAQAEANRVRRASGATAARKHYRRAEEWQKRCDEVKARADALEADLKAVDYESQEYRTIAGEDMRQILALATDLPRLLALARQTPGMLPYLMDEIIHVARVRCLGTTVYELIVEFPNGEPVRRVFQSGPLDCGQAFRVYCRERLARGADPDALGAEIISTTPRSIGHIGNAQWDGQRIVGAALVNEWFEEIPQRDGEHWSMAQIAARTGAEESKVLAAALDDRLGPALWDERGLCCRPTDAEVHFVFPEYARLEVAKLHGLDPDAILRFTDVRRANRTAKTAISRVATGERWADASGRIYVLKADVERAGLTMATPPAGPDLDEIAAALRAAGRTDVDPAEMHPVGHVIEELRGRFRFLHDVNIRKAVMQGKLVGIRAHGTRCNGTRQRFLYVHVPPKVWRTHQRKVIEAWLGRSSTEER